MIACMCLCVRVNESSPHNAGNMNKYFSNNSQNIQQPASFRNASENLLKKELCVKMLVDNSINYIIPANTFLKNISKIFFPLKVLFKEIHINCIGFIYNFINPIQL